MCIHVFVMGYMPHDKRIDDDMIHLQKKSLRVNILSVAMCIVQHCGYNYASLSINLFSTCHAFPQWCTFLWVNVKFMKQKVDENETDCRYGWFSCMFSNIYCDSVEYRDS